MPIYEYKCKACNREFEYQQRMSDPEKTDCEACGQPALERLISRTAFTLKGSGWYKDLYASPKPDATKSDAKSDTTTTPAKESGGDKAAAPAAPSTSSGGTSSGSSGSGTGSGTSGTSGGSSSKAAASSAS